MQGVETLKKVGGLHKFMGKQEINDRRVAIANIILCPQLGPVLF
jgi:hypothetical protein